jgi:hypothetical protein
MEQVDTLKGASLGERLLAGRDAQQAGQGEFQGRIDCGGGYIVAYYRALPFREDRKVGLRHRTVADPVEREVRMAADTLATACTRCEVYVGDEDVLGLDAPENDIQAVLMLFPSERAMIEQFVELEEWTTAVNKTVDKNLVKNSEAAS